jgi:alpha-mannosidase
VVRPELDQLPGACKNYLTAGRWVDVSNDRYGVTWATLDAPLIEVGDITVDVDSPFGLTSWIKSLQPSARFYSYVMNNYWETNYKAEQEGVTRFRYSIRPHASFDSAAATRFGIERSQPLFVVPANSFAAQLLPSVSIEPSTVIVTLLKPAEDGKGVILRLFNACDRPQKSTIQWKGASPRQLFFSSPFEETGAQADGPVELPPWGIVTLRTASP